MPTPQQILAAARLLIYERAPYFRAGVLQLVPREVPKLGTFATTKNWIMLWDPEKATEFGVEGTAAVVVHELWHLLRDHFGRFSAPLVNQDLANIAGDLSINPGVAQIGFRLPKSAVFPAMLKFADNLTAEQYYAELQKMEAAGQIQYSYYTEEGDGQGKGIQISGCGSCSGRPVPGEPTDGDAEGRSESEGNRTRITIAKAIREAKGRGYMPADLARWSDEVLKPPKVRWEEKLARACRAAVAYRPGSGHSSYVRVSRRQAGLGFGPGKPVLPSFRATVPRVTFLVDTSGSMGEGDLAVAMAEAQGVLLACGTSIDFVVCDAAVHAAKRVRSAKEACKLLRGGGGSDFCPAFDQIARMKPRSDVIVAATDGHILVPGCEPPGVKVIWLLIGAYAKEPCGWGVHIRVEN